MTAPAFALDQLSNDLRTLALELSGQSHDPELAAARLADGARDAGLRPPTLAEWKPAVDGFDTNAWQRLELLVRLFRESAARNDVAACLRARPERVFEAFPRFCVREAQLLTLELLLKSQFRVEELARKWIHVLGGTVRGEDEAESRSRRERLDFGGVLKNLEAADKHRAERMRKLQELEEKRRREEQEAYQRSGRE